MKCRTRMQEWDIGMGSEYKERFKWNTRNVSDSKGDNLDENI